MNEVRSRPGGPGLSTTFRLRTFEESERSTKVDYVVHRQEWNEQSFSKDNRLQMSFLTSLVQKASESTNIAKWSKCVQHKALRLAQADDIKNTRNTYSTIRTWANEWALSSELRECRPDQGNSFTLKPFRESIHKFWYEYTKKYILAYDGLRLKPC